ncbi:hypothetical protein KKJ03_16345 [Xenorhabdus bovienii]|nr:hypothetical protein [Xenorhabdus bovienii]MDE9470796.1 hypothetical protein [Xenorhabdus bovienii]
MNNMIKLSIEDNSNVIIGQVFNIEITFDSDTQIEAVAVVELKNLTNITASENYFSIGGIGKQSSVFIEFTIASNIKDGEQVSFDIVPGKTGSSFSPRTVNYIAKDIDVKSLALYFYPQVIYTVGKNEDNIPPNGKSATLASAIVTNSKGEPLPGLPITIIGADKSDLDNIDIFLSNKDEKTKIEKKQFGSGKAIDLNTDKHGKLNFYIYPKYIGRQFIIRLRSFTKGMADFIDSKNKIFVIDDDHSDPLNENLLSAPDILEIEGDELIGTDDSYMFSVSVDIYNNATVGDTILFFVDGEYSSQQVILNHLHDLGSYFIQLPYAILPLNKYVSFYYVIGSVDGGFLSSQSLGVVYGGGGKNQPLDNVTRVYDMCAVYSSSGAFNSPNLVFPHDMITYFTISDYTNNKNHDGLFIVITGTNDPTDKTKVPLGSEVILTLYINSYKKKINKNFTVKMPDRPKVGSENTVMVGIPHKYVSDVVSYPSNGAAGTIYFDYQVNELGNTHYGKIWQARIDTGTPSDEKLVPDEL